MRIDAISIGRNPPHEVNVIVEVPVGGEPIKYEMDKAAGTLIVDRFLYTANGRTENAFGRRKHPRNPRGGRWTHRAIDRTRGAIVSAFGAIDRTRGAIVFAFGAIDWTPCAIELARSAKRRAVRANAFSLGANAWTPWADAWARAEIAISVVASRAAEGANAFSLRERRWTHGENGVSIGANAFARGENAFCRRQNAFAARGERRAPRTTERTRRAR